MYTLQAVPGATENFKKMPLLRIVPVLNVLAIANIPRQGEAGPHELLQVAWPARKK